MKETWVQDGGTPVRGARRNGVRWNEQEDLDLLFRIRQGDGVTRISVAHERLPSAIEARLDKLIPMPFGGGPRQFRKMESELQGASHSVIDRLRGHITPEYDKGLRWVSRDGRVQIISEMDLSHLLNVVNDCNFRVELMRHQALKALGNDRKNVNQKTIDAFEMVTVTDVFPAWPEIAKQTKTKFRAQFAIGLVEMRRAIYKAWTEGSTIPRAMSEAVRFYLMADTPRSSRPVRMMSYVTAFRPDNSEEFRTMCWNLRIDQPQCWAFLNREPILRNLVKATTGRQNSALTVEPPTDDFDDQSAFELFYR